jgi:HTH-type transcriptional regulator, competence development regulator
MTIGRRIKELRKRKSYTQKQLAQRVKVSSQVISNWEREYTTPDSSDIARLANVLEISADVLINEKPKNDNENSDSLSEINKLVKEYGIEQFGFFDIDKWKDLSPEDIEEIKKHFEYVVYQAKLRNEKEE